MNCLIASRDGKKKLLSGEFDIQNRFDRGISKLTGDEESPNYETRVEKRINPRLYTRIRILY